MALYTNYETYKGLTTADCAAAFKETTANTSYAIYAIVLYVFRK